MGEGLPGELVFPQQELGPDMEEVVGPVPAGPYRGRASHVPRVILRSSHRIQVGLTVKSNWKQIFSCRNFMSEGSKREFESVVQYFDTNLGSIQKDLTFLLGFYVSNIVRRWWTQYQLLPWPDTIVLLSHGLVNFQAEKSVEFCQTVMRYGMLSYILCIRRLSKALRALFPDNETLIKAKVATKKELNILEKQGDLGRVWWMPLSWSMMMIRK